MDIEKIINESLKSMTEDYDLEREVILNVLHINIDKLIFNAEKWFNKKIPPEYREVIRSLLTITTSFFDTSLDYEDFIIENRFEEIDINLILEAMIEDFSSFLNISNVKEAFDKDSCVIVSSKEIFRRSINNILLSLFVFMNKKTECVVETSQDKSNVFINIKYTNLNKFFPGKSKIVKSFFPYKHGSFYKVGIGINSAIYNLRNIGAQVRVKELDSISNLGIYITFPSVDFLHMVDDLRKSEETKSKGKTKGNVLVFIDDFVVDMIVREIVQNNGYQINKYKISLFEKEIEFNKYKAIIVDFEYILKYFINFEIFEGYTRNFNRVIILYGSEDNEQIEGLSKKNFTFLEKPFQVDEIIKNIEKEPGDK